MHKVYASYTTIVAAEILGSARVDLTTTVQTGPLFTVAVIAADAGQFNGSIKPAQPLPANANLLHKLLLPHLLRSCKR